MSDGDVPLELWVPRPLHTAQPWVSVSSLSPVGGSLSDSDLMKHRSDSQTALLYLHREKEEDIR